MIIAGEASGDMHGASLVQEMHAMDPDLLFYGVGGAKMQIAGVKLTADAAEMAVVGLTEAIARIGTFLRVMRRLKASLKDNPPDLLILIDYPDFNLPLAKAAYKLGIKVLYYISPQVWAWRKGRIDAIRKCVDQMVVILPFEEEFYRRAGVNATFVGHPLLDVVKTELGRHEEINRLGFKEDAVTVALLPGSRKNEVSMLLPEMLGACEILSKMISPVQFLLPLASTVSLAFIKDLLAQSSVHVKIVQDGSYDAIAASDAAIVASGTATLETALLGTPMVVVYRISGISFAVGKRFIKVDYISLANLIAQKRIVPELIQSEANSQRIAAETRELIINKKKADEMRLSFSEIREKLGRPGASQRAAKIAWEMLSQARSGARQAFLVRS
jgi:lipid-A-disaccharide synthase